MKGLKDGRQHSKTPHRACFALEITARPRSAATGRSKSLLGRAAEPLGVRNHRSSTLFRVRQHSKSLLGRAPQPPAARNRCSGVPRSLLAFEITARARFFVFGNTRKRRPSVSARSRGSSKRRWIRQHFRVSCGIPFEIALLRTLHCFELCFARLHRHRQVPYANLVYIYIYVYLNIDPIPTTKVQFDVC